MFWIDFRNRIETITLSNTDVENLNAGNTRHRGLEGEISYDILAPRKGALHLTAFGNIALLDATFIKSDIAGQVGKTPAYAPDLIAKYGLSLRRDGHYDISVTGVTVSSQYWQDSDLSFGSGATFIPAKIPSYTVIDFAGDLNLTKSIRVLGGISNVANRHYYSRVFQNGIEPGRDRKIYAGLAAGF